MKSASHKQPGHLTPRPLEARRGAARPPGRIPEELYLHQRARRRLPAVSQPRRILSHTKTAMQRQPYRSTHASPVAAKASTVPWKTRQLGMPVPLSLGLLVLDSRGGRFGIACQATY